MKHVKGTLLALALAAGCSVAAPAPTAAQVADRVADIAAYRDNFMSVDRSFSPAARTEAETRLVRLQQQAGQVSEVYFQLELARITALADNGHTLDYPYVRTMLTNRVPVRLRIFGENYYVLRATAPNAVLLGGRLTAIDGVPIARVREAERSLAGGIPARRDMWGETFIESPEQLQALSVISHSDCANYAFELPGGRAIAQRLCGEPPSSGRSSVDTLRVYSPARAADEDQTWRTALALDRTPWAFADPDTPFRWRMAPEIDGMVIDFRSNSDMPGFSIRDFVAEVSREIDARHPHNVVIDQRLDFPSGDMQTTREFAQTLPSKVTGRMFVLTGPWTFSAAIATTAYLKMAAPNRVSIVGETMGDRLHFFAEGRSVVLPNSRVRINYAMRCEDFETGCRDHPDCYPYIVQYPIEMHTLAPDIHAPWTIEDYLAGRDPGMQAVARALRTPAN